MNLIRLRLRDMTPILEDKDSDVRVVLLVRDPRAVLKSRENKKWCRHDPDCGDPGRLCQSMMEDYNVYRTLSRAYPGRLRVVRYEDLSLDPFGTTRKLTDFLGAPFTKTTSLFLKSRTQEGSAGVRVLNEPTFSWRDTMTFSSVDAIQRECLNVTTSWGYRAVAGKESLADPQFIPLSELHLPDN